MVEIILLIVAVAYYARRGRGKSPSAEGLPALLGGAESAGIITATQREQLLAYAEKHAPAGRSLGGAAWLGVFAGLFVAAGVSLLIARNWEQIGPTVRVGAFLVGLLAVGEAAIRTRDRSIGISVPLELLWFFLPLLGIGLYAQTFQVSGDALMPFLVWLALTIPLAWASSRPVIATIHTGVIVLVLFTGNYVATTATWLIGGGSQPVGGILAITEHAGGPAAWGLSLVLLGLLAVESLWLLPRHHRHHFVGVWVLWILSLLAAPTVFHLGHPGWLVVATVALTTLWVIVLAWLDTSLEERATSMTVWLAVLYALTFTWHMRDAAHGETTSLGIALVEAAVAAAVAGVALVPSQRLSPRASWAWAAKALLVVPLGVTMLYLTGDAEHVWIAGALMNVILILVAVGLMWHGSLIHETAQINLGVLVLVGMLITRFIDVFGNMLRSGIGFIVAGLLLAGLSWALERTRRRLIGAPDEVAS